MDVELNLHQEVVSDAISLMQLTVAGDATLREIFLLMKEQNRGSVLICEDDVLKGIFTEQDALTMMSNGTDLDEPVSKHMHSEVITIRAEDRMATAITRMFSGGVRRLPVVDDSRQPVGVLKATDVMNYLVEHFPEAVYNINPNPDSAPQSREGA